MNILYLHKRDNFDTLKYSLRSLEKFCEYDEVYVVGDKPDWAVNVNHIECEHLEDRYEDVNKKFHKALDVIPKFEDYLYIHDDIYLLKEYEPIRYYNGLMKNASVGGARKELFDNMVDTGDRKNYAIHYPMPFKYSFIGRNMKPISIMNQLGFMGEFGGYFPKKEVEDCKFKNPQGKIDGLPCFSTHSEGEHLLPFLLNLYPEKSIFER